MIDAKKLDNWAIEFVEDNLKTNYKTFYKISGNWFKNKIKNNQIELSIDDLRAYYRIFLNSVRLMVLDDCYMKLECAYLDAADSFMFED